MLGLYSTSNSSSPLSVPIGAHWTEPRPTPPPPKKKSQNPPPPPEEFLGDQVLARSIAFMRETMISREAMLASAEGDVGRLYEVIKVMLFTFAGSPHSNYTAYFLEMITKLEWESGPELKAALLALSLVNLTGREGGFAAGDTIQEYFNRILEAVVVITDYNCLASPSLGHIAYTLFLLTYHHHLALALLYLSILSSSESYTRYTSVLVLFFLLYLLSLVLSIPLFRG